MSDQRGGGRKWPRAGGEKKKDERKRWKQHNANAMGSVYADIPGLPASLSPLQGHALQQTTRLIRKDFADRLFLLPGDEETETNLPSQQSEAHQPMMESLWNRVERAQEPSSVASDNASTEQEQQARRRNQQQDAVQQWLQGLHRAVKDEKRSRPAASVEPAAANSKSNKSSVAVAALEHLWKLQLETEKSSVRRAALHCTTQLLQKSADGRRWLLSDQDEDDSSSSRLVEWIQQLSQKRKDAPNTSRVDNSVARDVGRLLWQREAFWLLQQLQASGYGELYPTLVVGLERLRQSCPQAAISSTTTATQGQDNNNMADWRRQRDLALQYVDPEEERVHKLLRRCQACLDVLVPRIVHDKVATTIVGSTTNLANTKDGGDNEKEDDVDWEDGWEEEDEAAMEQAKESSHAEAVERTLAVMETTAGIRGGELVIDMHRDGSRKPPDCSEALPVPDDAASVDEPAKVQSRERLQKCVRILDRRHRVRLSSWLEGLTLADGLVLRPQGGFVALPQDLARRRRPVQDRLMELKSSIANMLQSARRLGLEVGNVND